MLDPRLARLRRLTIAELPHHDELQDLWAESVTPDPAFRGVAEFFAVTDTVDLFVRAHEPSADRR